MKEDNVIDLMSDQEKSTKDVQSKQKQSTKGKQLLLPHTLTPNNSEVQSLNFCLDHTTNESVGYELPFRHNQTRTRYPIANHVCTRRLSRPLKAFVDKLSSEHTPSTIQEALNDSKWIQVINEEMITLKNMNMWRLIPLLEGKKVVGYKWVFSIKYKADGSIDWYKARLLNTIRVVLSLTPNLYWPLHQFHQKNAFLLGDLEEKVYLDIPPRFIAFQVGTVCMLQKALYGLKQSLRAWFGRLRLAMKKHGFKQSNADHTLFLKHRERMVTTLIIYVNDMIITRNEEEEITNL
ncbi:Reverse transcriptase [Theobroma cacao]|nr:Reverse transcriptase [Theobroma cacao]